MVRVGHRVRGVFGTGGGSPTNFRGNKATRRALGTAMRTGDSALTKMSGLRQQQTTGVTTAYGSSTGHLTPGQNQTQNLPNMMRVFQSGTQEPASWSAAQEAFQISTQASNTAFMYTWKGSKGIIDGTPSGTAYNNLRNKWLNIMENQVPDVAKSGGARDTFGWYHEPFGDTSGPTPAGWAQAQINLQEWVSTANLSRQNKLAVVGVMNGHTAAHNAWGTWFNAAFLAAGTIGSVDDPQIQVGIDCYDWITHPNQQITWAHDFSVAHGGHPWCVPELGWVIGNPNPTDLSNPQERPTDAQTLNMAQTVVQDINSWTPQTRPVSVLWFNNGGQPFDGVDVEGRHQTCIPDPGVACTPDPPNVPLPNTLAYWKAL